MKAKTATDYIDEAIKRCQKDIEYHERKAREEAMFDLPAETIKDPKFKKRWDRWFANPDAGWKRSDEHRAIANRLNSQVLTDLATAKFYLNIRG